MSDTEGSKVSDEKLSELEGDIIDLLKEGNVRTTDRVEDRIKEVIDNAVETED